MALAELVRSGEASPLELVDAAIARIERINPQLNAVVVPRFEKARAEAASAKLPDGPFRGVPLLLKDALCHTAGDPHYEGMRFLKRLGWTEQADSYLAAKFRQAGFVFLGRTNTPELSLLPTCESELYGKGRNPWNPGHSTGGSSGGSAAAVASHMVSVAHGTDAGGSIRIPASNCGVVGLRASRGRLSLGPDYTEMMGPMLTVYMQGVLTRTVRDSAAILDVISGAMPGDGCVAPPPARPYLDEVGTEPGRLRIGMMTSMPGIETHPDCVAAVNETGKLLESLGHTVEESGPSTTAMEPPDDAERYAKAMGAIRSAQTWHVDYWSRRTGRPIGADDVEPYTWAMAGEARSATALDLLRGMEHTNTQVRQLARWADLLAPTNEARLRPFADANQCAAAAEARLLRHAGRPAVRAAGEDRGYRGLHRPHQHHRPPGGFVATRVERR